jgi:hypothetical protein
MDKLRSLVIHIRSENHVTVYIAYCSLHLLHYNIPGDVVVHNKLKDER